ncbi:glycosyl transferase [Afifella sp. IM 167]|uniref:glycosyl transferase n=1 Tax=Afifella sp. IM 167 TaxID=2033586 RepID=UPI001CCEB117|nr:glycosyl transferase [Afifella sp. IM 167]MBZ8134231.1 glycosyl transferase [Afifella sp. IM 167]
MGMLLAMAASAFLVTLVGIRLLRPWLARRGVMDHPGERTNHALPVPRGAGLALVPGIVLPFAACLLAGLPSGLPQGAAPAFFLAGLALALVAAVDDFTSLRAAPRLVMQCLLVALAVAAIPPDASFSAGLLPLAVERGLAFLFLLSFINAMNFMDGIDGITGMTAIGLSLGVILLSLPQAMPALALIVIGGSLGFLAFNWHPASIFLGDVGAVFLGFMLAALLLALALGGDLAPALVLPAYYLTDTGLTLALRAARGEKVWLAHSQHAYQKAVRRGWRHDEVVMVLAALMALDIGLAFLARPAPILALLLAYGTALGAWASLRTGAIDRFLPGLCERRRTS